MLFTIPNARHHLSTCLYYLVGNRSALSIYSPAIYQTQISNSNYCPALVMSHFPDISELDSPALSNSGSNAASAANFDVDDPTADFLARERAALGGDIDLLNPQPPASTLSSTSGKSYSAFGESIVAMEMDVTTSTRDPDTDQFERNFPALDNVSRNE
jgi:hypothetical protein